MKPTDVKEAVGSSRDELYQLAIDLVRTPSVTGNEDTAQDALAARLGDWGLDVDLWTIEPSIKSHGAASNTGRIRSWHANNSGSSQLAVLTLRGDYNLLP